jgi:PAS domain-containing protein
VRDPANHPPVVNPIGRTCNLVERASVEFATAGSLDFTDHHVRALPPRLEHSPIEVRHDMTEDDKKAEQIETLLGTPDLADALESDQFRLFLDQVPIAIVVSKMKGRERIVYANPEFEKLSGQRVAEVEGESWNVLHGQGDGRSGASVD